MGQVKGQQVWSVSCQRTGRRTAQCSGWRIGTCTWQRICQRIVPATGAATCEPIGCPDWMSIGVLTQPSCVWRRIWAQSAPGAWESNRPVSA